MISNTDLPLCQLRQERMGSMESLGGQIRGYWIHRETDKVGQLRRAGIAYQRGAVRKGGWQTVHLSLVTWTILHLALVIHPDSKLVTCPLDDFTTCHTRDLGRRFTSLVTWKIQILSLVIQASCTLVTQTTLPSSLVIQAECKLVTCHLKRSRLCTRPRRQY